MILSLFRSLSVRIVCRALGSTLGLTVVPETALARLNRARDDRTMSTSSVLRESPKRHRTSLLGKTSSITARRAGNENLCSKEDLRVGNLVIAYSFANLVFVAIILSAINETISRQVTLDQLLDDR